MAGALQLTGFGDPGAVARTLLAYVVVSAAVTGVVAMAYRWYVNEPVPEGITALVGTAAVALYLNTTTLGAVGGGTGPGLFDPEAALFNLVALGVALAAAPAGRRLGDRTATDLFVVAGADRVEGGVSRVARSVGRVTPVTLPDAEDVGDMPEYDPVSPARKAELGGRTLLFPRRLTVPELRDRLVTRLKEDHGVAHVDVELDADGTVTRLAVGSRVSGLGPSLAPGSAALAVRTDPANGASPGDVVQVWRPDGADGDPERVLTAELRATAGDVATLVVDEAEADSLPEGPAYRLVTLPASPRADREFAATLRAADETVSAVTVGEGSVLAGRSLGDLPATVVALKPPEGPVEPVPLRSRRLAAGETAYLLARPEALRQLRAEAAAGSGADAGGPDPEDTEGPEDPDPDPDPDPEGPEDPDPGSGPPPDPDSDPGDDRGRTQPS